MTVRGSESTPGRRNPRVLFLARSLTRGGAERQLVALANGLHRRRWEVAVACFYAGDVFQADLERAGVPVIDLKKRGRWDVFGFLFRLFRAYRRYDPDVVHGYLPIANMLALWARFARRGKCVVWGVRASNVDLDRYDWLAGLTFRVSCLLSRCADCIIANSHTGAAYHVAHGYPRARVCVIPNGIDTGRFRFDPAGRRRVRAEWNVAAGEVLVGLVGRLDPMKDHPTFLRAAAMLACGSPEWRFVCVGSGPKEYADSLVRLAGELGLAGRLVWAGARDDMAAVYSALDMATSTSSYGEGFQNVVGEAMACGVPCVVTDVGDSARVVGECGVVVPASQPAAVADGLERTQQRIHRAPAVGRAALRQRIEDNFSVAALVERTASVLERVYREAGDSTRVEATE